MATARLGKDVVDIEDVSVSYGTHEVLHDVTWRIAPGERTGVLGVNGAGKSTLLGLVTGAVAPTTGRVKRGKTIRVATLTQELAELADIADTRVNDVIARYRTSYVAGGKEMTPGQLLERLGFTAVQLQTPVKDLSGGQRRRLQLLLILLDEPNVLVLDEPSNDLDTDMLAAMEDLLDTWPGTLLVVSHDRYLLERVTDQQYAVLDGRFRHVPGGVDEYLRLLERSRAGAGAVTTGAPTEASGAVGGEVAPSGLDGAALRAAKKELGALDRRISKLTGQIEALEKKMAEHDPADYVGLTALGTDKAALEAEVTAVEEQWMTLAEAVEG